MKLAVSIANRRLIRLLLGALLGGGLMFVLFYSRPGVANFAVPIASISGAYWCNTLGRIGPALVQGGLSLFLIGVARFAIDPLENDLTGFVAAFLGIILGVLGGSSTGGILGGVFRSVLEADADMESP